LAGEVSSGGPVQSWAPAGASLEPEAVWAKVQRHVELFVEYFLQYAKVRMSYRGDFLISLATSVAATLFAMGFLVVLFMKTPSLAGWRFDEVLFLYGFSLIPYGIFNVVSLNLYEFGNNYIIEGKFDRVLLRPVSSLFQVLFEAFRIESLHEVLIGLFAIHYAGVRLGLHWTLGKTALLLFWGLCGGVIYISVFLLLSTLSFWFEDRLGVHPPFWNLFAFGRYPLRIYNGFIQFVLTWIIPFGFASFYPSARLIGRAAFSPYAALIPVVAALCLTLSMAAWRFGTLHYESTGS
jgi:ABC-2 type transport system permease protein